MKPEQIGQAYNQIADLWDKQTFNNNNGIAQHERAIGFTDKRGAALDVGCGWNGRFIDLLLGKGFAPEGLDISGEMISRARKGHPDVTFYQDDICDWQPLKQYDFITAWDSIWHVPLDRHERVLEKIFAALAPGGVCIFSAGGLDEPSDQVDDFMGPEVYYSALGVPKLLEVIAASGCICRHLEYDQRPEVHLYLIVQKA
ncbi:class I SAM-dependent methyltransferase [Amphritea balenae]|uniref:Class I SAM-dependent methyltransferase n=1 Tax=Amphritea balenae TaxID=452629 RepID=A0A3P1SQB6_9GAMM|nr:class I SAM-dependent methyltransferase [Amphritea balenae]RRC99356.1 class I SAM-dependent methyltransferase [Amphritea balenae]GGK71813.1 methyltransferase [Amphritea balenae]